MTHRTPGSLAAGLLGLPLLALVAAGCEDEPAPPPERVRAIKPFHVVEPALGAVRRYSGAVAAANSAEIGFAVSGTVAEVQARNGDRVAKGATLAALDARPFELDVQAARSRLASAQAEFDRHRVDLDRQRELFRRGWVARAALETASAAHEAAEGNLNLARSRLGLAERDLAKTRLTAPFDGVVARRAVEPFAEISKGQVVFRIDSDGALEVDLSVPDSVVGRLAIGAPVTIETATVAGCGCAGRITEIGGAAGAANAVPVTAAILERPDGLLPGTAVEVGVALAGDGGSPGYLVPLVAIAPGDDSARGYVFKYDPGTGVVRKTPVAGSDVVSGNLIGIAEGVAPGDILAAAGVSFLRDGQRVRLLGGGPTGPPP